MASTKPARIQNGVNPATGWLPTLRRLAPGLLVVLLIAAIARILGRFTSPVPDVVIALAAGVLLRNTMAPRAIQPGVKFTVGHLLRVAIVLLGAGLSAQAVFQLGSATLVLIIPLVIVAVLLGLLLARLFNLRGTIGTLLGAGTAICGGSAVLTVGSVIDSTEEEMAYAITTIFTFNVVALIVFPPLGHMLKMSEIAFGAWAGTAVNDTSVVVSTGYLFGPAAGATATVVKLARTVLLVPLAVAIGLAYAWRRRSPQTSTGVWQKAAKAMPWFILGFLAMATLNSLGVFSPEVARLLAMIAGFLMVMVLASVGLNVDVSKIRRLGTRPMLVGLLLAACMAVFSLALITLLRIE
jgi:uncharacterized integral membrane protein (TIGR00698 family)